MLNVDALSSAGFYQASFFGQESSPLIVLKQLNELMEQCRLQNASSDMINDYYKCQMMYAEYKTFLDILNQLDPDTRARFARAHDCVMSKMGSFLRHRTLKNMLSAFQAIRVLKQKVKKISMNTPRRYRYSQAISTPTSLKHSSLAILERLALK